MKKSYPYLFFTFLLISVSCSPEGLNSEEKVFFDLEALISAQISILNEKSPEIVKTVEINGEKETLLGNEIDWEKELEIIKQSDLNKAAYTLSYEIQESDTLIQYILKEGETLPIKTLEITKNTDGEVLAIRSNHLTDNYLYKSGKTIEVDFKNGTISNYHIEGWQELFIGSRKEFRISGNVKE